MLNPLPASICATNSLPFSPVLLSRDSTSARMIIGFVKAASVLIFLCPELLSLEL